MQMRRATLLDLTPWLFDASYLSQRHMVRLTTQ